LIDDVRAFCRTLLQVSFRLGAISKDTEVIKRLIASAESLRKKRALLFKSGVIKPPPNTREVDWDVKIAELEAALDELGRSEVTDKELATIADRLPDYYSAYALLSDAAHASVADIEALVEFDEKFNVVGFRYGPHDRQFAAFTLYAAKLQLENLIATDRIMQQRVLASQLYKAGIRSLVPKLERLQGFTVARPALITKVGYRKKKYKRHWPRSKHPRKRQDFQPTTSFDESQPVRTI
jgi:hypothetical protein